MISDSEILSQLQNNESLVNCKEIRVESQESDDQDQDLDQNNVEIPNILINSLEVIDEEDTQRTR